MEEQMKAKDEQLAKEVDPLECVRHQGGDDGLKRLLIRLALGAGLHHLAQAEELVGMGIRVNKALLINVPDDVLVDRVQGRVVCDKCGTSYHLKNNPPAAEGVCDKCGGRLEARKDDRPETVRARLKVYHDLTDPVVEFYRNRGVLSEIDGTASIDEATAEILKILEG